MLNATFCSTQNIGWDFSYYEGDKIPRNWYRLWNMSCLLRLPTPLQSNFLGTILQHKLIARSQWQNCARARSEPGGTRWRTGGEVKGKLANGMGSQYSHATSERDVYSITKADAHTSAASSRLNWRPHRFKWTRQFRGRTKSGFCACAITFRTSYKTEQYFTARTRTSKGCEWKLPCPI